MKIKLVLTSLILLFIFTNGYSQYKLNNLDQKKSKDFSETSKAGASTKVYLGGGLGFAYMDDNTGLTLGLFAEIKTESFSLVPQANYWKIEDKNNFEVAGLVRLRFKSTTVEPYVDGGLGINFLSDKKNNENKTKVGLDLGGGVDYLGFGVNYTVYVDAKYKIIVSDPNVKGYTITGGVKFNM